LGYVDSPIKQTEVKIVPDIVPEPPSIPELKEPELPAIPEIQIVPERKEELPPAPSFETKEELPKIEEVIVPKEEKVRKRDPEKPPLPLFSLSGTGPASTTGDKSKKTASDFIFVGSDYETVDDEQFVQPKKIGNLENT